LFIALYGIISALFTSITVFLPNYSSGNIKTNSIQPVSACLAFYEASWHFFASGLAFLFTWTWQPCCSVWRSCVRNWCYGRTKLRRTYW